jgi:biotin carboxylase
VSAVVIAVVPRSGVRPARLSRAAAVYGHSPVFVAARSSLDEQESAEYSSFGPLLECEPGDPAPALRELRRLEPVAVVTFTEALLPLACGLADGLGLPFLDPETLTLATDKWAQRQRLAASGVDSVWSAVATSRGEALDLLRGRGGPVVIKPRRSQNSIDTYLVENAEQFPAELTPTSSRPFVVEEYLKGRDEGELGDYVSVESLVADGEPFTLGVTGKLPLLPPFREQGHFIPSHLPAAERAEIGELASAAARALGIRRGLVHTEIKITEGGPRIIEVNARIGGFISGLYERGTGQDLLELGIAAACGQPVTPRAVPDTGPVRFVYWNGPPLAGGELRAISGADEVRQQPGVISYLTRMPAGSVFAPGVVTYAIDALAGEAPDHQTMLAIIDGCAERLRFTFREPDGPAVTWQASRAGLIPATA